MACSVHTEPVYALWDLIIYFLPESRLVHIFPLLTPSFDRGSAWSNSKSESAATGYKSTVQQKEGTAFGSITRRDNRAQLVVLLYC